MASAQQSPAQQTTSSWTEPPWSGWIGTTEDALLILEAARRGLIPRVTRRLVDSERKMITSGSVFVFDEDESGIKRWTDGFFWSPSRILGNFLLYRETEKRGAGHRSIKADQDLNREALELQNQDLDNPLVDKSRQRCLMGSLMNTNTYKFKPEGLMKKTFSLTIGGVAQHLISYYKIEDVEKGRLRSPASLPELASLDISPEYLDKTHFRNPPKVEVGADGVPRYRGEADDIDTSVSAHLTAPLATTNMPLLMEGRVAESPAPPKKVKRYGPYDPTPGTKRPRKKASPTEGNSPVEDNTVSPVASTVPQPHPTPPAQSFPENHAPMHVPGPTQHVYPTYGISHYYPGPVYHHPPPPTMHPGVYSAPMTPQTATNGGPAPGHYPTGYPYSPTPPGAPPPIYQMTSAGHVPPGAPQTHGSDPSQAGLGHPSGPQSATPPGPSTPTHNPPGPHMYHPQGHPQPHYAYYYSGYPPHPGAYQWHGYAPHPPTPHSMAGAPPTPMPPPASAQPQPTPTAIASPVRGEGISKDIDMK